ncbi:hypothetical protein HMPREF1987_00962 [Peptostreptococcaceae bacterium oral taxon 113 str. W5053]|nr:hypothetical protein HMPREF1987_00962 [Peptostreptococcaceae bacterium oral taxon 113 str. W5053]
MQKLPYAVKIITQYYYKEALKFMSKKLKRIFSVVLFSALVLSLAACGGKTPTEENGPLKTLTAFFADFKAGNYDNLSKHTETKTNPQDIEKIFASQEQVIGKEGIKEILSVLGDVEIKEPKEEVNGDKAVVKAKFAIVDFKTLMNEAPAKMAEVMQNEKDPAALQKKAAEIMIGLLKEAKKVDVDGQVDFVKVDGEWKIAETAENQSFFQNIMSGGLMNPQ